MIKNSSGQLTVEAVLILAIFVAIVTAGSRTLRNQKILSSLVQSPWIYVSGMIENGVWAPPQGGRSKHPNHIKRHGSPSGESL